MQIQLTKEHEDWLRAQVAAGRFPSLEDAIAEAIDGLRLEDDELAWAKPLVAEGLAELDRGEAIPADEVFARIEARLRGGP
jgi:antitoxin ParD1/3/4